MISLLADGQGITMHQHHVSPRAALSTLAGTPGAAFAKLFEHGTLEIEIYKPVGEDKQQPHERDEVYVVISGSGMFMNDGVRVSFAAGDVLFVPAGVIHRFEQFTDDFAVWVFFYGPIGGEAAANR